MHTYFLDHIALSVKDVHESVDFYQKVFQLQEVPNTASVSKTRWLAFHNGRQIHLIPRPAFELNTIKAVHFALSTPDIHAMAAHLESLGIAYSNWHDVPDQIHTRDDGINQLYFQDPNGYWIEINNDPRLMDRAAHPTKNTAL